MATTRAALPTRRGFTLVELLVTITVIAILAGVVLGGLNAATNSAKEASTRSLIAKLDQVMRIRYESYMTRRVPIRTTGMQPRAAAEARLAALRDLIRMELPERGSDIKDGPATSIPRPIGRPAISHLYLAKFQNKKPTDEFGTAECLYLIISTGSAETRAQFRQRDSGDADNDGWPEFHDGWGRPIMFLRWAPGFSSQPPNYDGPSEIQKVPRKDNPAELAQLHDPFDVQCCRPSDYHLTPLIYSGGADKKYDIELDKEYSFDGDPYASAAGTPVDEDGDGMNHHDNIHNHTN